jgi:hypothetical protein
MAGEWYYKVLGQEAGPVSPSDLEDLAESGFLTPEVLVRKGADGDWIPAGQVRGLFGGIVEAEAAEPSKAPPAVKGRDPDLAGAEPVSPDKVAPTGQRSDSSEEAPQRPPSKRQASKAGWYCQVMGEESGPLSSAQLKELAASGFLTPDVPVRKGVEGNWVPASRVKGLFAETSQTPADKEVESPAASRPDSRPFARSEPRTRRNKALASSAPPRPAAAAIVWYYRAMGEETGPLSSADLKELAKSGLLTPEMPVRMGVDGDWLPAGQVRGLFGEPSDAAPARKARRPAGPAGAAGRSPARSVPKATRKTAAGPAPKAPRKRAGKSAPRTPIRPSSRPAARPAEPAGPQPPPPGSFADFLDEALAEPTPGGAQSGDGYRTLPSKPAPRPSLLSSSPDAAAFESPDKGDTPVEKEASLGEKVAAGVVELIIEAILSSL